MTTPEGRRRTRFSDDLKRKLCQDQNYLCMYCGRKRAFTDMEIDHKTPVKRGGSDNPRNLQVLCPPCNKRKGNQTDSEFRRRYKNLLPRKQEPPQPAIRQDAFDMVTATTNRPRNARANQQAKTSAITPAVAESLNIRREGGFFTDALKLTWTAPDSDEPITGYRLQYRVASGGPDTGWLDFGNPHQGNLPRFEVNQVPQSQRFAFRVRARNAIGWGQWSKPFSEIETEQAAPQEERKPVETTELPKAEPDIHAPGSIAEVSFKRIPGIFMDAVLTKWTVPDSVGSIVNAYQVQFRMHQGRSAREWTDSNPKHDGRDPYYRFNNVPKPDVNQFSMRIRARNDAGWGAWSQEFPDTSTQTEESAPSK